jgi:uncharacterized membrane protein
MNKKEFLEELEDHLIGVPKEDREEVLQDYADHFRIGKGKKRSEADIIKSLGEPKDIAREIRRELASSKNTEITSEAIETWVAIKKLAVHLFMEARDAIGSVLGTAKGSKVPTFILFGLIALGLLIIIDSTFLIVVVGCGIGFMLYQYFRNKESKEDKKKSKTSKTERGSDPAKVIISVLFNALFFVWLWISIFATVIGFFISSIATAIAGTAVIVFSAYSLVAHGTELINGLLYAGLFAGIGVLIFGGLLIWLSKWVTVIFFALTKGYIDLNMRFVRK